MEIIRTIKTRIYPSKEQINQIEITLNCCRFIYNHMLARQEKVYKRRSEYLSYYDMQNLLPKMKKYLHWLKDADSRAIKYSCRYLDKTFQKFFKKQGGYPRFKKKHNSIQSYSTEQSYISYKNLFITLPKLGNVKHKDKRSLPSDAKICEATVIKENDKYYCCITYKYEKDVEPISINENQVIGLDYSSSKFYMDNNGNTPNMPHFYKESEHKLAKLNKQLSKKVGSKKGEKKSNRWIKKYKQIYKLHQHITNQRKDWLHKHSTLLAEEYDAVIVEGMNMTELVQSHKYTNYHKRQYDNAYGMFRDMLEYKMTERGKQLVRLDKNYPSSKMCSCCGEVQEELPDNIRKWICPNCNTKHDRDLNASVNIRNEGLKLLTI